MAYTMQQLVDRARIPLNDDAKDRYADSELLSYANDAVLIARKRRPDMFLGQWSSLPGNLTLAQNFPLDDEYVPTLADYVTARAEFKNDESVNDGRGAAFLAFFEKSLLTL